VRLAEVTCHNPDLDSPEIVFLVRDLTILEVREILATGAEGAVWQRLCAIVPEANLDLRHRVEIIHRATLNPPINLALAILMARADPEAVQNLSSQILELTCLAAGFESVAALHTRH